MPKILIADDELLVRVGIASAVPWSQHGFTILQGAGNGREALEIIRSEQPDILLTDIKMPEMDGLELIRKIKEENHTVEIVVLSSYDDFELVREAMRLGATDYLRKLDVLPDDLLALMLQIQQKIPQSSSWKKRNEEAIRNEQIKYDFFASLIADPNTECSIADMRVSWDCVRPVCLLPDAPLQRVSISSLKSLCEEVVRTAGYGCEAFVPGSEELGIVVDCSQGDITDSLRSHLRDSIYSNLNLSVSVGVGPICSSPKQFSHGYHLAREIQHLRFYLGEGCVGTFEHRVAETASVHLSLSLDTGLLRAIKARDAAACKKSWSLFFDALKDSQQLSPDTVKRMVMSRMGLYTYAANQLGVANADLYLKEDQNTFQTILKTYFLHQLLQVVDSYTDDFVEVLNDSLKQKYSQVVRGCIDYILQNLHQNISLTQVAAHLGVSEPYLSTLFKKETGSNFVAYINHAKVDVAKQLLAEDVLIYQIADQLGYENSNYFTKVFRRHTGQTPESYRRTLKYATKV